MKRNRKKSAAFAAVLMAAVLAVPQAAFAQLSPEFARSSEEWARLRDNKLEWDEIPALVHEYNTTVVNGWVKYNQDEAKGLNSDEYADKLREDAQNAYDEAVGAADGSEGQIAAAEMAYKNAMASADAATIDGEVVRMTYEQTEAGVVAQVQGQLVSWYTAQLARQADQLTADYQQKQYDATVRRKNVGEATQLEVLTAEQTLKNAQAALITDETNESRAKQELLMSLGWKYNDNPEIAQVPEPSDEEISAVNLEADIAAAQAANYTLRINERKLSNAKEQATKDQLNLTIKNGREQVKSDMTAKYRAVLEAKSGVEQQKLNAGNLQSTLDKTSRNYALGAASARELETAQYNADSAQIALKQQQYALAQAWINYQNALNGLASAGTAG